MAGLLGGRRNSLTTPKICVVAPLSADADRRRILKPAVLKAARRKAEKTPMDAIVNQVPNTQDQRAEALVASYERAGYARIAPAILQPAEPFLDLSGEDIRKRMYLTTAPGGGEFCLRPDLTIPVSCDYLASPAAGSPSAWASPA